MYEVGAIKDNVDRGFMRKRIRENTGQKRALRTARWVGYQGGKVMEGQGQDVLARLVTGVKGMMGFEQGELWQDRSVGVEQFVVGEGLRVRGDGRETDGSTSTVDLVRRRPEGGTGDGGVREVILSL